MFFFFLRDVCASHSSAHAAIFEESEDLDLNDGSHLLDKSALQIDCECHACRNHSKGYITHLIATKEMLAATLLSFHNLHVFQQVFRKARQELYAGNELK